MKIYLSKSNLSDPVFVEKIRSIFSEVEIIEFNGGKYDPSIINDAQYLVVIPPVKLIPFVGKGVGSEILHAKQNDICCYMALDETFLAINNVLVHDTKDWQKNYYKLMLHDKPFAFKKIGEEFIFEEIL